MRRNRVSPIDLPLLLASKSLMILHNNLQFQNAKVGEKRRRKRLLHLHHLSRKNHVQLRRMQLNNKNILRISSESKPKLREKLQPKNRPKSNSRRERTK